MVIEHEGVKILTDPGNYTVEAQQKVTDLDAIVITHEHQDHYHLESIKKLVAMNPGVAVVTNSGVGKLLSAENIAHTVVGDGQSTAIKNLSIEGFGRDHAPIYGEFGRVENTAFLIGGKFYFPGDNFHTPGKPVEVLALPVAGPWMKISEAVDFAKLAGARIAFGVHDGMIMPSFRAFVGVILKNVLPETEYIVLEDGATREF